MPEMGYDPQDDMYKVKSLQKKWRSDFAGNALNTDKWDIVQQGAGHIITVAAGELKINTGTTINSETILQSKEVFTDPVRALFGIMLSQRIANQEFYVELVSVDNYSQSDGQHKIGWRLKYEDYTTAANYAVYETQNNAQAILPSAASYISNVITAFQIFELELFSDEAWFHTRGMDSPAGRSSSFVRHQQIPDPNAKFKIRIRAKNLATAPATATDMRINFVNVTDYAELTAEITAGRGNSAAGQSIAAQIVNTPTVMARMDANNTLYTDSATNLAASATYTGTGRDSGVSYQMYNRFRAMVMQTAGLTPGHLVYEQSADNITYRETHRVPIPSDGQYRTFEFPINLRFGRVKFINGVTAQTAFFLATGMVRSDGPFDLDKTISFTHSTTALAASAIFTGVALNLGPNHSINRHRVVVTADQTGTLYAEQSRDGVTWRVTSTVNTTAGVPAPLEDLITMQYVRVRYANGATLQGSFELVSALIKN